MSSILADRQYTLSQFKILENLNISNELTVEKSRSSKLSKNTSV